MNIPIVNTFPVSTDDTVIRRQLRDLHEPMCLFGEGPAQRRKRLEAFFIANPDAYEFIKEIESSKKLIVEDKNHEEIFYYEGSEELKHIRYKIAQDSIRQSSVRLDSANIKLLEPKSTRLTPQLDLIEKIREIQDKGSFVDDDISGLELATITSCNFNASATQIATSFRSGKCKIWRLPEMGTQANLRGHEIIANYITFHPKSGHSDHCLSAHCVNLASCSMDGSILLWNLVQDKPFVELSGPQSWKVRRVRFYIDGSYLATCCSDNSWRLWDLDSKKEVLHQEGHASSVHDLNFHPDGSLAGSASLDSSCRIWDLRTGRSIYLIEGHSSGVTSIDFSPDGYHIATGSMDNSVKIWNLRQRKLEYSIPAHTKSVTKVQFEKENGYYLSTSSLDTTVKFWSTQTWAPIKTLEGYDNHVTDFDCSPKSNLLTTCYFKFVKLWSADV